MVTVPDDAIQAAALVRQRRLATGLLLVTALVFLASRLVPEPSFWTQLVRAASEAALVGGLADWFAVTALFRHPLGVPIPHTAIIPRNKDRIGISLGRFVERHFLEPALLTERLRRIDLAGKAGQWLARPENAQAIASRLHSALPWLIRALDEPGLRTIMAGTVQTQLRQVNLAPMLGRLLEALTTARHHQALFDRALALGSELLLRHEERIYDKVAERSGWWVPPSIDRTIARKIVTGLYELLDELAAHDHAVREGFDRAVEEFIERLKHSQSLHARVAELRDELLTSPLVQEYLQGLWEGVARSVSAEVGAPESQSRTALAHALSALGAGVHADAQARERLNMRLEAVVLEFGVGWRREIGNFIADVVRDWDADTITHRLELVVGRDLQYIRINGTVVGALVGVGLFLIGQALPIQ